MRILISFALFLSYTVISVTQDSWYRDIRYEGEVAVTAFHMLTTESDVYIAGKATCIDSLGQVFTCMSLAKHAYNGDVAWWTYIPWANSANEGAISLLNDTLIVTGHYFNTSRRRVFVEMFSLDGIHLKSDEIVYDSIFHQDHGFWINGQILLDRNLYIQCETRNLDKVNTTITTKYNIDTGKHTYWDLHIEPIGTPSFSGWDLCLDIDSNFVVSSEINMVGGDLNRDIKQITKFDQEGNILDKFYSLDHDMSSSVSPEMTVMEDGRYVLTHNIDEFIQIDVPQLVCIDPRVKDTCWTYDYPSKLDTNLLVSISQLSNTKNGDIIGTGCLRTFNSLRLLDYYVFRMSPDGVMLWERTFVRQDQNDNYLSGGFRDINELSDGSILAIGTNGDGHIAMMRLSANGCLMDKYCESLNFLGGSTSVTNIADEQLALYPNPATEKITINLEPVRTKIITIASSNGIIMLSRNLSSSDINPLEIDVSSFPSGVYYIIINDVNENNHKTKSSKFIKY